VQTLSRVLSVSHRPAWGWSYYNIATHAASLSGQGLCMVNIDEYFACLLINP